MRDSGFPQGLATHSGQNSHRNCGETWRTRPKPMVGCERGWKESVQAWPQPKVVRILAVLLFPILILLPLLTFHSDIWANAHGWMVLAIAESSSGVSVGDGGSELPPPQVQGGHSRDRSCDSRWEHLLYRRPSKQHRPFAELVRAWDSYQELHLRCTRNRSWAETFRNPSSAEVCKFLYYEEGYGGLGNRLLSLVSAFTYALLTQRVLVMDAHSNLAHMLCEPFEGSSWLLPEDFPYWEMLPIPHLGDAASQQFKNVTALYLQLLHEQSWGDQLFFCSHIQQGLQQVPWIAWRSNQYYVPRLFTMPGYWEALTPLFPNVTLAFTHLSRRILLPQNPIWARILRVHWSYLAFANQQVGLQIRRHSAPPDFDLAAHARVMECVTEHRILPNVSSMDEADSSGQQSSVLSKVREQQRQAGGADRLAIGEAAGTSLGPTVVLVASLQIGYSQELKKIYTDRTTADGSLVRVHQVTQDGAEWASYQQAVDAFTEMWLLSFSDYLATSSWSTFGYIAQGLGGLHPYLMNIKGEFQKDDLPACFTGQSIEPCNHFPFLDVHCGNDNKTSEHLAWIERHVRSCQDETRGVQLVEQDLA